MYTPKAGVWAPTIFKHPINKKYYLAYQINLEAPQRGNGDAFDGQFFVDKDNSIYISFGGGGNIGICKTKFDEKGII
jgi:hypothetical protein